MADISRDGHSPALGDLYVVQELIGEGPTGCVFKATDRDLRRTVALKLLAADDPREVARLQRVAKAQARLGHEHVCRIYDVGEIDGRAYVAMQFIDGRPLRSMVSELDMLEKAELVEGVARGVQAAHTAGLLHRDLKPSNIMVERRSDGRLHPSVIDFGVTAGTGATADPRLGTPSFMAPEQLRGEAAAIDHLTDVYGLGATLFAVLAEQVPFFGPTRADTVRQVLDEQPLPLGLVVPGTPRDLETIAAVAMAKDPAQRYPSAGAFADDLRHWLDGEPIRARSDGPLYRLGARLRTGWVSAAVLASVVTFSTMAAASVVWLRYRDGRRTVLTASYEHEVWQMDRLLRQARMMPLHDTSEAEHEVRSRLAAVRETLLADGFLARGAAYYTLGFGHLLLREPETAEPWLRAALESGFDPPVTESALGTALAAQILEARQSAADFASLGDAVDPSAIPETPAMDEALRHLLRGENSEQLARYHQALAHFLGGQLDAALQAARDSSEKVPWLYEALELEGEILLLRSMERVRQGEEDRALADLRAAGRPYRHAMEIARSDPRVYDGEARRGLHLLALHLRRGEFPPELFEEVLESTRASSDAHPHRATPYEIACRAHLLRALHARSCGGNLAPDLQDAMRLAKKAVEIDPDDPGLTSLLERVKTLDSESVGTGNR